MGCLSANISLLNTGLEAKICKESGIEVKINREGNTLSISHSLLNPPIDIFIKNIIKPLQISFGVVCSIESSGKYLKVSPYDIQWITPNSDIVFIVKSNVDWTIETN